MQSFKLKFLGVTILQGVKFPIFLLIFEWALQQCSATALPVMLIFVTTFGSTSWCCFQHGEKYDGMFYIRIFHIKAQATVCHLSQVDIAVHCSVRFFCFSYEHTNQIVSFNKLLMMFCHFSLDAKVFHA